MRYVDLRRIEEIDCHVGVGVLQNSKLTNHLHINCFPSKMI